MIRGGKSAAGLVGAAMVGILAAVPSPATAHDDHGLVIEATYTALFRDGRLSGFEADWRFDELFSLTMMRDFDIDHNGALEAAEVARLSSASLPKLREGGFFTHVAVGDRRLSLDATEPLQASVEEGRVRYRLRLGVRGDAVDLRGQKAVAILLDPAKEAEIVTDPGDLPIALQGAPSDCRAWPDVVNNAQARNGRVTALYLACAAEGPPAQAGTMRKKLQ